MIDTKDFLLNYLTSPLRHFEGRVKMPACGRFFEPKVEFVDWCKKTYPDANWVDCGAGQGHVVKMLREAGLSACGIDLFKCDDDLIIGDMIAMNSAMFPFSNNMVALICRPSRGDWIHATIIKAVENGCPVIYVGKSKHIEQDLTPLPYQIELVLNDIGEDGENLWLVIK
jgi:hypothetical protein